MSSRKVRYYDSSTGTTSTAKFNFDKNKRYKWNKTSGAIEEITSTNTLAEDEITLAGSKSSLRRISDLERNISILASKAGVSGATNTDTDVLLKSGGTITGSLQLGDTNIRIDGSDTYPLVQVNTSRAYFGSTSRNKTVIASGDTIHHVRAGTEYTIWTEYNDGAGSGLDADLLDGVDSTSFLRSDTADTSTGKIDFQGGIVVSNPVGTGHIQMGNINNHSGNGYIRGNILLQRDQDQITYDSTVSSWTHAGGSSTDWSMIAHTSGALEFYSGPSSSSAVTYTHADFETNFKWLSTNHVTGAAGRSVNLYGGLSVSNSLSVTGNVNATSVYSSDEVKVTFNGTDGTTAVKGYGIEMSRVSSYLRPTTDGTQTLYIGGADASLDWSTVDIKAGTLTSNAYVEFGNGVGSVSNDGNWHGRLNVAGTSHARIDVKDLSSGVTTTMYSHTGQNVGKVGTMSDHPVHLMQNGTAAVEITTATLSSPTSITKISDDAIQFGGANSGYETNSAQISAGYHATDTLCIVGMGTTSSNRKIRAWAEGGFILQGTLNATEDVCAYSTSDVSFKENVAPISNPLDKVMAIRGVEFDWNDDYVNTRGGIDGYFTRRHDVGVIAQEVESVMPEVVGTRPDGTKGVRYEKMVGLLIEAIKDQQQQIEELKSKLEGK